MYIQFFTILLQNTALLIDNRRKFFRLGVNGSHNVIQALLRKTGQLLHLIVNLHQQIIGILLSSHTHVFGDALGIFNNLLGLRVSFARYLMFVNHLSPLVFRLF